MIARDPNHRHGTGAATGTPPETRLIESRADLARAVRYLDAAEADAGVPLVDEAERERLRQAMAEAIVPDGGWRVILAELGEEVVGYGAVVPAAEGDSVVGDVVIGRAGVGRATVRSVLLKRLIGLIDGSADAGTSVDDGAEGRLQIWMRHVSEEDLAGVDADGFRVARRLGILGRQLTAPVPVPSVADVTVRAYRPDDAAAVVGVLAAAYAGTDEEGWTESRFQDKRAMPWFRDEDLLVAEEPDGRLVGLHWLKRREPTVGEVYNLAIHPDGQGHGLGPLLLASGLEHLRAAGMHEVLLWVDRSNERAVGLYTGLGFTTRWDDVALERPLRR